jgi:D-glycero-D-manno-heptose 1,7-bisphosphate phosphatase
MHGAVFLDRDGTLIEDVGHLGDLRNVRIYPDTISALQRLKGRYRLFIVTNQPGVAEGSITMEDVNRIHAFLLKTFAGNGIFFDQVYVCPHRREDRCDCIKPKPYFLHIAAKEFRIDLRRSFVVGDHPHDVELAKNVGAKGVYLLTGHGERHLSDVEQGTRVVPGIREAAALIMNLENDTR